MDLLEQYHIEEAGFHPFLIKDSWQVGKLNYNVGEHHINNLNRLTIHHHTDRALSLLKGKGVLITVGDNDNHNIMVMERGTAYNIPKNHGYAIVMQKGGELFSVERPNTHTNDTTHQYLDKEQVKMIQEHIYQALKDRS